MSEKITRREFLKVAGLGGAASLALGGHLPAAPSPASQGGRQTLATACPFCSRGCGMLVTVEGGRVARLAANPTHPLSCGASCARAMAGRANTSRILGPMRRRPGGGWVSSDWGEAGDVLARAFRKYRPSQVAFVFGLFPDHLYQLAQLAARQLGGAWLLRYGAQAELDGNVVLRDATQKLFGLPQVPYFEFADLDLALSFGTRFTENWLPPNALDILSQGSARWVHLDSLNSGVSNAADEWLPIRPGSEGALAAALACLIAERGGLTRPAAYAGLDISQAVSRAGLDRGTLEMLAGRYVAADRRLALPGAPALGNADGLAAAEAILALNTQLSGPSHILLPPPGPLEVSRSGTLAQVAALLERIRKGEIKALFVHGVDLPAELPGGLDFIDSREKLDLLVSFSPFQDGLADVADWLLPDLGPFETTGYQVGAAGSDRPLTTAIQPVMAPTANGRSSADVLLEALAAAGKPLPFTSGEDFVRQSIGVLNGQGGQIDTPNGDRFWDSWLVQGGWWPRDAWLAPVVQAGAPVLGGMAPNRDRTEYPYHLALDPDGLGEGQTIWVKMHPGLARRQGIRQNDSVRLVSPHGALDALVRFNDALDLDILALPVGFGALKLYGRNENESGALAFSSLRVRIG